jgi:hypothetical protein
VPLEGPLVQVEVDLRIGLIGLRRERAIRGSVVEKDQILRPGASVAATGG